MKEKIRKYMITALCMAAFILPMLQPLTVRAAETGQFISVYGKEGWINENSGLSCTQEYSFEMQVKSDYTVYGYLVDSIRGGYSGKCLQLAVVQNNKTVGGLYTNSMAIKYLDVLNGTYVTYNGERTTETELSLDNNNGYYRMILIEPYEDTTYLDYSWSGIDVFSSLDSFNSYLASGTTDGLIEPPKDEVDKSWFLKNVNFSLRADDSPTSEAGEDATYVKFTWDIDNLQDGDLLEIKTHSYLKKIGGDQIIGFHDFITHANNVSAYSGEYELSQYDATKAWFATLENKPLIFKSYDTDAYYLRPWRNGVAGGWVRISMSRATPSSSPYVNKVDYGDFDEDGEWIVDDDLTFENGGGYGIDQNGNIIIPEDENLFTGTNISNIMSKFFDFMKSLPALFGDLPALLNQTIGFLPVWIIGAICAAILVAIILRIVGR